MKITFGQKAADYIAEFGGSWKFIFIFSVMLIAWIITNIILRNPFDPYPFIFLNLVLSCIAAMQAPVIMMSNNRQSDVDRKKAEKDHYIALHAEKEIHSLHKKVDELHKILEEIRSKQC